MTITNRELELYRRLETCASCVCEDHERGDTQTLDASVENLRAALEELFMYQVRQTEKEGTRRAA